MSQRNWIVFWMIVAVKEVERAGSYREKPLKGLPPVYVSPSHLGVFILQGPNMGPGEVGRYRSWWRRKNWNQKSCETVPAGEFMQYLFCLLRFYGSTIAYVLILIWRETRKMSFASSLLRGVGAPAEPHLLTWFTKLRWSVPYLHIRQGFGSAWIQHDNFNVFSLLFSLKFLFYTK